ncbi:MAG: menaquinol-cytochrome c reductase cytochrome b subunit [Acidimicrobiaceae bacterium]|nr:menaquinol-cytochrome c reductase cytochrome b subunit [Acidimicrobiaceae bacterium]MCY4175970.1 menaquinol-cytochrome c reductase cytochrome b subunit [Acidimicrobiaceae bacterium]MCY4279467.1 menaquinol-cytochrome c reductase cytochrome b subunit [Acidimicrobiaceae bacterium]MCY4294835.1 menaquinol-cytochrome c reductase cytochrome b subunit [Acidimicrobiaceae bacterium]
MAEIPEHLRKRAEEARAKAEAAKAAAASPGNGAAAAAASDAQKSEAESKIPAHLLERSKAARAQASDEPVAAPAAAGEGSGGVAVAAPPAVAAAAPGVTGPGGHTQRLLTVVKSGSIQDVKSKPQDKVHVWPHLLVVEFVAALFITAFTLVFAIFVNAPLLELANFNQTPNPSKAPWYFLGLQELLTMFHPMVAGVTIPGIGLLALMLAPYIDKNPSLKPEDRKFALSLMTIHLMFWAVLVIIGSFFRGPGFNFIFPWDSGLFFEL